MSKITLKSKWFRKCITCNKTLYYANNRNLQRAVDNGKSCNTCRVISDEQKIKLSISLKSNNFKRTPRPKDLDIIHKRKYFKNCPNCNTQMGYTRSDTLKRAEKNNTLCNSCAMVIYKKSWNNVITKDSIKKMRAKKAGYKSWEEYLEKYPQKKKYKAEVWSYTYKQPLHTLNNFEKRGRMGIEGAWQIDHIISIDEGYKTGIIPEQIGSINNLQMLPWKENLLKSNSIQRI